MCSLRSSGVAGCDQPTPTRRFSVAGDRRLAMTAWSLKILSGYRNPPKREVL